MAVQEEYQRCVGTVMSIGEWALRAVIKLLKVTHGQWLYWNIVVHDDMAGTLATMQKEEMQREMKHHQELGNAGLQEKMLT